MFLDILLVIVVLWGLFTGYRKGLVYSVFSLVAFVLGTIAALKFSHLLAVQLEEWFNIGTKYLPLVSFIGMFLLVVLAFVLVAKMLEGILKVIQLNFINKISGGILWSFLGIFILSTLYWYMSKYDIITERLKDASRTYEMVEPVSPLVMDRAGNLMPFVEDMYETIGELIDDLSKEPLPDEPIPFRTIDR